MKKKIKNSKNPKVMKNKNKFQGHEEKYKKILKIPKVMKKK